MFHILLHLNYISCVVFLYLECFLAITCICTYTHSSDIASIEMIYEYHHIDYFLIAVASLNVE